MLQADIERLFDAGAIEYSEHDRRLFQEFKNGLNVGKIRAAEPDASANSGWRVNAWVKKGILLGFRMGAVVDMSIDDTRQPFFDKSTYPVKRFDATSGVRIVPGGSSVRDGCYVAHGVTCMPPMFINAGAFVDEGTMVDSHALVGSCAQIGKKCHISAAAQIGGVLEPVGALPVIIEDEVLVGGNCGIYEGTVVKRRAVLGTGTILNRSTPVYDIVTGTVHAASDDQPLIIPENAVLVAGSRAIPHGRGKEWNLSLYTPVIVKYRDAKTDAKVQLEELLR
ncbi:MAG TPA: 2,3,4,5-tetrahydropyridine-2,6-dicarboxylate N-succinyltransferase [Lacipirellulaceae bacterium]|nr:2,3,4,5-tetrahydropyridine-2,6-dicarboxylate N-succinyltransferase [Lacipirellulaceae bacterium]HXU48942.1 2,3,4,5-tetrahydropyridine-2,6-dicarboxylate N-succinyltransferase [Candidatus Binatia bacterium]